MRRERFYSIMDNEDGTVDVFLTPAVLPLSTPEGNTDYDVHAIVIRGVEPFDGMEEDIRRRYNDWCKSGEEVYF